MLRRTGARVKIVEPLLQIFNPPQQRHHPILLRVRQVFHPAPFAAVRIDPGDRSCRHPDRRRVRWDVPKSNGTGADFGPGPNRDRTQDLGTHADDDSIL